MMGAVMTKQIQVFLGTQPRLLREMLQLALSQLLENATVTAIEMDQISSASSRHDDEYVDTWLVMSAENADDAEKHARTLLGRHPDLLIAALANDARALNVYQTKSNGEMQQNAYSDFSLVQLIEIFERAGT